MLSVHSGKWSPCSSTLPTGKITTVPFFGGSGLLLWCLIHQAKEPCFFWVVIIVSRRMLFFYLAEKIFLIKPRFKRTGEFWRVGIAIVQGHLYYSLRFYQPLFQSICKNLAFCQILFEHELGFSVLISCSPWDDRYELFGTHFHGCINC